VRCVKSEKSADLEVPVRYSSSSSQLNTLKLSGAVCQIMWLRCADNVTATGTLCVCGCINWTRCSYVEMKRVEPAHPVALLGGGGAIQHSETDYYCLIEAKDVINSVRLRSDGDINPYCGFSGCDTVQSGRL